LRDRALQPASGALRRYSSSDRMMIDSSPELGVA
jgi:hypothetical protein